MIAVVVAFVESEANYCDGWLRSLDPVSWTLVAQEAQKIEVYRRQGVSREWKLERKRKVGDNTVGKQLREKCPSSQIHDIYTAILGARSRRNCKWAVKCKIRLRDRRSHVVVVGKEKTRLV